MPAHHFKKFRFNYEMTGAGETALILIHGLGGSNRQWRYQKEFFSPKYQVVTPDLFEHGASEKGLDPVHVLRLDAGAIIELIENVIKKPCFIVGHSLAGLILGEILRIGSSPLRGAVFVDCAYQKFEDILAAREKFARSMLALDDNALRIEAEKWYRGLIGPAPAVDEELILNDFLGYNLRQTFLPVLHCREFNKYYPPDEIPISDSLPILILEADGGVGGDFRRSWVNHFKTADYYLFEHAKHFFFVTHQNQFNAILARFLSSEK